MWILACLHIWKRRKSDIQLVSFTCFSFIHSSGNLLCCRSSITREKFEELCDDLWEKALVPLKEVLAHSGLKIEDIYAVELIGGATRVPKLQV